MTIEESINLKTNTFVEDIKNIYNKNGKIFNDKDETILRIGISFGINLIGGAILDSNINVTNTKIHKEETK